MLMGNDKTETLLTYSQESNTTVIHFHTTTIKHFCVPRYVIMIVNENFDICLLTTFYNISGYITVNY